jgi:broad specificity phosphatase PhoE
MKTVLYLLRHGATEANQARPPRLQGRRRDPPLSRLGIRQAEATRDLLAVRPIDCCYTSPLLRAVQTATIVAAPHGIVPQRLDALTECDVGRWEDLDWHTIAQRDSAAYARYMANPAQNGYPEGESFGDVYRRVSAALEDLMQAHARESILVVAHHVVNRTYLAGLLGLPIDQARSVRLDNCGISVVTYDGAETSVSTLNAAFHLQGVMAA